MKVLVACEESQRVCIEFRNKGHETFSCDLKESSGGHPEWHIVGDCLQIIYNDHWDLPIAHPPCTYLSNVATRWHSLKSQSLEQIADRTIKRLEAAQFFMNIVNAPVDKIAIENPLGIMSTVYRKPDQIIHPYYFADSQEEYVTKKLVCG